MEDYNQFPQDGEEISAVPEEVEEQEAPRRPGAELYEWLQLFLGCVVAAVVLFNCVARLTRVDGGSMDYTLQHGEIMLIWSLGYTPKQGDVVVLNKTSVLLPDWTEPRAIVKRVIATGGQTVDVDYSTGTVYVDGQALEEPYIREATHLSEGTEFPFTVPEGCVFLMGDNRNGSRDSRAPELGAVDAKFIGKKLVLKGDIQLVTLYQGGAGLVPLRFELPYSQILDLGETAEEAEPEVVMTLKSVDCRLREGELEVTLEALAQAALWVRRSVTLISDAYCLKQPIDVERTPARLCTMAERTNRRETARKLCESGIPAKQVLDCAVSVTSMASAPAEGGMEFTAQAVASILYLSEDDALCGVEVDIPVSCRGELPPGCTCSCTCRPVGEATAVPVTGGLEVRFEAEFAWTTLKEEQAACVTDLKPSAAKETGVRPSVVIRRVERGEALWDIAKSCGSTVEDICSANGLPAREAAQGELLLIPARRC